METIKKSKFLPNESQHKSVKL
jgi:hypothetical protein